MDNSQKKDKTKNENIDKNLTEEEKKLREEQRKRAERKKRKIKHSWAKEVYCFL